MVIDEVVVRRLAMTFKEPSGTSFAVEHGRDLLIVEALGAGEIGYGECVATARPDSSDETTGGCQLLLDELVVPLQLREELDHPEDIGRRYRRVHHNEMAIAAIEGAVWDLDAKQRGLPLARALGGTKTEIEVGVKPEVTMDHGIITVPQVPGLGYAVRTALLDELSRSVRTYTVESVNDPEEGE